MFRSSKDFQRQTSLKKYKVVRFSDWIINLDELFDGIDWRRSTTSHTHFFRDTTVFVSEEDAVAIGIYLYWGIMRISQTQCGGGMDAHSPIRRETNLVSIPESFYNVVGNKNKHRELIYTRLDPGMCVNTELVEFNTVKARES